MRIRMRMRMSEIIVVGRRRADGVLFVRKSLMMPNDMPDMTDCAHDEEKVESESESY